MPQYFLTSQDDWLREILKLQKQNLPDALSQEEISSQGYVSVDHSFDILKSMAIKHPHVIAVENRKLVGYCLAMTKSFREDIALLVPMFLEMDQLPFRSGDLSDIEYMVCGQVCVHKDWRGKGVFKGLYQKFQQGFVNDYPVVLTEIASNNTRSIRAHEKVGFDIVHSYPSGKDFNWEIVMWKWRI